MILLTPETLLLPIFDTPSCRSRVRVFGGTGPGANVFML